ncbi:V-type proton ATPase subunit C [Bienertia sinuspersici]
MHASLSLLQLVIMTRSKRKRSKIEDNENESKLTIKILVDTKSNKVLFAEAGKDFVDFLFHIMSLPIGTIIKLLNVSDMVGSLGTLYKSINSLSNDYFNDEDLNKDTVLNNNAGLLPVNIPLSLSSSPETYDDSMKLFLCSACYSLSRYVTDWKGASCPKCGSKMNFKLRYFRPTTSTAAQNSTASASASKSASSSSSGNGGYVKGVVTYMVMDDLEVKPMSTISGITLISKFAVSNISALEEKQVQVGFNEGLALLKASMETKNVLTTVFLNA